MTTKTKLWSFILLSVAALKMHEVRADITITCPASDAYTPSSNKDK